jgi:hypothetical protein
MEGMETRTYRGVVGDELGRGMRASFTRRSAVSGRPPS